MAIRPRLILIIFLIRRLRLFTERSTRSLICDAELFVFLGQFQNQISTYYARITSSFQFGSESLQANWNSAPLTNSVVWILLLNMVPLFRNHFRSAKLKTWRSNAVACSTAWAWRWLTALKYVVLWVQCAINCIYIILGQYRRICAFRRGF